MCRSCSKKAQRRGMWKSNFTTIWFAVIGEGAYHKGGGAKFKTGAAM